jgi:hypothetical protein
MFLDRAVGVVQDDRVTSRADDRRRERSGRNLGDYRSCDWRAEPGACHGACRGRGRERARKRQQRERLHRAALGP